MPRLPTQQLDLTFHARGGKRKGAGRKRSLPGPRRVAHRRRPKLDSRFPVHITTRIRDDVPRLRNRLRYKAIRAAMCAVSDRNDFAICHFSVQKNHLHLICEADDNVALAAGIKRFKQRVANALNGPRRRTGPVFFDRYHMRILKTPRHTRNTLCYVLQNARRHQVFIPTYAGGVDPYSSAWWFDGWRDGSWRNGLAPPEGPACVSAPGTWLLAKGWRRAGLIGVTEMPAAGRR